MLGILQSWQAAINWLSWTSQEAHSRLSMVLLPPLSLRIISHNIRYATSEPFPNERPWIERAPLLTSQLKHETAFVSAVSSFARQSNVATLPHIGAFICLQEVLHTQLSYVMASLNRQSVNATLDMPAQGPLWSYVGVGRDDGKIEGEYSPIIYPTQLFKPLDYDTIWLSPTPSMPSKGWDAASIRILNIAAFEHRATGRRLVAANTHLDDQGAVSRREGVKVILEVLREWQERWRKKSGDVMAIFLAGDFNSKPEDDDYRMMKSNGYMADAHDAVQAIERYGNEVTFTGFEPEKGGDDIGRIDFVWLGPNDANNSAAANPSSMRKATRNVLLPHRDTDAKVWNVQGYAVLPNAFDDGIYLSDHRGVVVDGGLGG